MQGMRPGQPAKPEAGRPPRREGAAPDSGGPKGHGCKITIAVDVGVANKTLASKIRR